MQSKLILFCGPSGSGKTSIVKHLLASIEELSFSVSATTRDIRNGEVHGKDYYFLSGDDFHEKIRNDEFLEWEEVYENVFYGTLRTEVDRISSLNKIPIFDMDVEGGIHLKGRYEKRLLDVFVMPPSIEVLKQRLISRASETSITLERRVRKAEHELAYSTRFTHVIINDELHQAYEESARLVRNFISSEISKP